MTKLKSATALAFVLSMSVQLSANAEPKYVLDPYVCNVSGNPNAANAQWISISGRGQHTLQLTLSQAQPTTSAHNLFRFSWWIHQ